MVETGYHSKGRIASAKIEFKVAKECSIAKALGKCHTSDSQWTLANLESKLQTDEVTQVKWNEAMDNHIAQQRKTGEGD